MYALDEHELKQRLARRGLEIPKSRTARTPDEAQRFAAELGGDVVLKALVPVGDRLKHGLVQFASAPSRVRAAATELLGRAVAGHVVDEILVEARVEQGTDHYLALSFDFARGAPVVMSGEGGSGIEARPRVPVTVPFTLADGPPPGVVVDALRNVLRAALEEFRAGGFQMLELNPVRVTGGAALVLDAKALIDPFTVPPLGAVEIRARQEATQRERSARAAAQSAGGTANVRYEELGGDIGLVVWGGGATFIVLDELRRRRFEPANYADVSAGSGMNAALGTIAAAVLGLPVRGVLFAACTMSAESTLSVASIFRQAIDANHHDLNVPIVARIAGRDEEATREILEAHAGVTHVGGGTTLEGAVALLAEKLVRRTR